MTLLSRFGAKVTLLSALVLTVSGSSGAQSSPQPQPARPRREEPAIISSVKILLEKDSPAVEIVATRTVVPTITKLENPLRLLIDLPNAKMSLDKKHIDVNREDIRAIQLSQYRSKPPAVRVAVDLLKPHSYTWDAAGNRLMVRLHLEGKEVTAKPPSVPVLSKPVQPVAVPVAPPASSGTPVWADKLAAGSSMSTTDDTTVLRLTRGGEIRVCPGTTVSISHSQKGPDLLLGMGTGAVETHYALENSADAIVTPDFRILLRGPGEFHYAIASDSRGNTCVRPLPGNTAPIIISELMGDGVFRVSPDEPYVFHAGHLSAADTAPRAGRPYNADLAFPEGCGCPARTVPPVMLASLPPTPVMPQPASSAVRLAQAGDPLEPLLPQAGSAPSETKTPKSAAVRNSHAKDVHIQVEARVVYPAPTQPATAQPAATAQSNLKSIGSARSESSTLVLGPPSPEGKQVSIDADQPRKPHKSVFGKIKGFFGRVFH